MDEPLLALSTKSSSGISDQIERIYYPMKDNFKDIVLKSKDLNNNALHTPSNTDYKNTSLNLISKLEAMCNWRTMINYYDSNERIE